MHNILCPNIFIGGGCKITLQCNVIAGHGDMAKKKSVFDKVMMLNRLKEEEVIVVQEVKQHMEHLRNVAGLIQELITQPTENTNAKCKDNL